MDRCEGFRTGEPLRAVAETCSRCEHWARMPFGQGACELAVARGLRGGRAPVGARAAIRAVGDAAMLPIAPACGDFARRGRPNAGREES